MEKQIKKRSEELKNQFNNLGKRLQELIAQKTQIEQQISLARENMLQIRGAHVELMALLNKPTPEKGEVEDKLEE